jgi:transposase
MPDAAANTEVSLPGDVATLQRLLRQLLAEVAQLRQDNQQLRQENQQLRERLDQAARQRFGPRSERRRPRVPAVAADVEAAGHGRQELPEHLPRRPVVHDLTEAERLCPCCGRLRACIGEQTSEQLDYEPAQYFVLRHVRKTYACRHADCPGNVPQRFQTAGPALLGPVARGLCGPGLLAQLVTGKYADHLPLHRQEKIVARSGVRLARSTLCDWMKAAADLLRPLVLLMRLRVLQSRVIHSDDTPVPYQVPGRERTKDGHLWVYIGDPAHPYVLFDFTTHYRRDGPEGVLKSYTGYLQADALAQYEGLYATGRIKHVACWAHARRKFVEAQGSAPSQAETALEFIRRLYAVEKALAERLEPEDEASWQQQRCARATPILEEFQRWLHEQQREALPKSLWGQAVNYTLSHWEALGRYREQAYLGPDNNLSERTLRQVAVGRKNWMFCGSEEGGQTAAVLYSVVGTCKHQGIDPFAYLREALTGLFALGKKPSDAALSAWLPDAWQRQRVAAQKATAVAG